MKLLWGPHTCAIGIHIVLEEIGKPYETEQFDVAGGAARQQPFTDINPKGKVPTLIRDDGSVLTEFTAIAVWLARTNPDKQLFPQSPEAEARALEVMAYVEGTVHGQGFARIIAPGRFAAGGNDDPGLPAVKQRGRQIVEQGFAILDAPLGRHPYAAGEAFSVADTALFYVERWAPQMDISLPANVAAHFARVKQRPAVRKAMEAWGEA